MLCVSAVPCAIADCLVRRIKHRRRKSARFDYRVCSKAPLGLVFSNQINQGDLRVSNRQFWPLV